MNNVSRETLFIIKKYRKVRNKKMSDNLMTRKDFEKWCEDFELTEKLVKKIVVYRAHKQFNKAYELITKILELDVYSEMGQKTDYNKIESLIEEVQNTTYYVGLINGYWRFSKKNIWCNAPIWMDVSHYDWKEMSYVELIDEYGEDIKEYY